MQNSEHPPPDDAILTADGELLLDEVTQQVAARLRDEAASLAERALPQHSYACLMERLRRGPRAAVRPLYAMAVLATVAVVTCAVGAYAWVSRLAMNLPQPHSQEAATRSVLPAEPRTPQASGINTGTNPLPYGPWPFVGSQEQQDSESEPIISYQQRIEMLEKALERYRAALEGQQERIRQLEAEVESLQGQLGAKK